MAAKSTCSKPDSDFSWFGLGGCLAGAAAVFVWLPHSIWGYFLFSPPSKLFPPMFATAFAAGWAVGLWRPKSKQAEQVGAIRSQASVAGMLTAMVAVSTVCATAAVPPTLAVAAIFLLVGMLPCALFATVGASFAHPGKERRGVTAMVAGAILPLAAALVWPVVYGVGKFLEKPRVAIAAAPVAPVPPKPRYVKPEGFDSANAWKRTVAHEDVIPNVVEQSPIVLSHDERRLAFVVHEGSEFRLMVRQLYDSGPDRSLPIMGGVVALAWSPDDRRIIFLAADSGAFWVCEPESGKRIPLPIPVLDPTRRHGLVWWREEDVLVYRGRAEPDILSLDLLRLRSANEVPAWKALAEGERIRIGQTSFTPSMALTEKVKFSFVPGTGSDPLTLALNDDETLYERFIARGGRNLAGSFPNRDGSLFFIVEPQQLRILYMGLRQSPSLRFVAESREDFPSSPAVSDALAKRAIRAAVAAPVRNPLNGKTVAGNLALIRGYARVITASGNTCSVWIEQERQPIREGDVLIGLTAIQGAEEFSASKDWWAILAKPDEDQSIPRRADVPTLLPSPGRELRPLPVTASPPPATAARLANAPTSASSAGTSFYERMGTEGPELVRRIDLSGATSVPTPPGGPPPPPVNPLPDLPPYATDEEKVRHFLLAHHNKMGAMELNALAADFGAMIDFMGQGLIRREEAIGQLGETFQKYATFSEKVGGSISLKRETGNRFIATYDVEYAVTHRDSGATSTGWTERTAGVLLTSQGLRIVQKNSRKLTHDYNPRKK